MCLILILSLIIVMGKAMPAPITVEGVRGQELREARRIPDKPHRLIHFGQRGGELSFLKAIALQQTSFWPSST
jgi:hypothetical protein